MNSIFNQPTPEEINGLREIFKNNLPLIADDLELIFIFSMGSQGFSELDPGEREDLTFRLFEIIRTFRAAA